MDDVSGFNFISTATSTGDSNIKLTGSSDPSVSAYCQKCPHNGYKQTLVSENMPQPVCVCTPKCEQIKGLKEMTIEGHDPGTCTFVKPDEGGDSVVSYKRVSHVYTPGQSGYFGTGVGSVDPQDVMEIPETRVPAQCKDGYQQFSDWIPFLCSKDKCPDSHDSCAGFLCVPKPD